MLVALKFIQKPFVADDEKKLAVDVPVPETLNDVVAKSLFDVTVPPSKYPPPRTERGYPGLEEATPTLYPNVEAAVVEVAIRLPNVGVLVPTTTPLPFVDNIELRAVLVVKVSVPAVLIFVLIVVAAETARALINKPNKVTET